LQHFDRNLTLKVRGQERGKTMDAKANLLVRRACSGEPEAFGELYELYAKDLYRYACYVLGSRQFAQDAVQDAVCAAFMQIASLRNPEAFKAWLFKILSNTCTKYITEKSRQRNTVPFDDDMEETLEAPSTLDSSFEMQEVFACLAYDERQIVLLAVLEGYTSSEISTILGCPAGTVRSKLSRALKKMRTELEK
jgi:RNA polymerase sigma factor (sigma-70 family)